MNAGSDQHADEGDSSRKKRRRSSSGSDVTKLCKYNGFLPLIKESALNEESQEEFEALIQLNVDVDYYDPEKSDCTPLCYAVQNQLYDWAKLLLENGADPALVFVIQGRFKYSVTDIAWSLGDYDIVYELILADAPYPQGFNLNAFKIGQKLKLRTWNVDFHKQIKENSFEKVSSYIDKNPRIKHAYDFTNKSALTIALECKNFKIYSYLRLRGFACGIDEGHDTFIKKLRKREQAALNREIQEYFPSADFHILNLLSKSRLGMNNDKKHFEKVKHYFEELDKIEEIRPILKIIANEKVFSIIFDFNESNIGNLDPVGCPMNDEYAVRGRTYKERKKILIAVKQRDEKELLGILAQELTHFALLKVYGNECLPYRANDTDREIKFSTIVEICRLLKEKEEIINAVYGYEDSATGVELIARVPQLFAQNSGGKLSENRRTFAQLFDFYTEFVMKDIENEALLIEPKQNVQELNKNLGVLHRLKTSELRFKDPKASIADIFERSENIFISSKLPDLALLNIIEGFKLDDLENIFVGIDQLINKSNLTVIAKVFLENFKPTIFVIDSVNVDIENVTTILEKISKGRIVFLSERSSEEIKINFEESKKVEFNFCDLVSDSQKDLQNSEVDFQGKKIMFKNIFGEDLDIIDDWPLGAVLDAVKTDCKLNDLETYLPKVSEIFMPRSFQISENSDLLTADEVLAMLEKEKTIVIADVAGMGKTTSAVNFAKAFKMNSKLSWIVFFDLKQHTEIFEGSKNDESWDFDEMLEKMLKLGKEVEQKVFRFFFSNSNAVFVIDGFDEISPKYNELVVALLQHVQRFENRLLVTTRTHLKGDLSAQLGGLSLKLLPFTKENQIEFLTKFWIKKDSQNLKEIDFVKKARTLVDKFIASMVQKQIFLEIPLQLFMLADLTSSNPGTLNIDFRLFSLYNHFIKNKISIWIGTPLARTEIVSIVMKQFDVILFHQKVALGSVYGSKVLESLQLPNAPQSWAKEVICRVGFLQVGVSGHYQFSHQTFGDYFVAQMFLNSITTEAFQTKFDILHNLLAKVLVGSSHYDENIKNFLNEKLEGIDTIFHNDSLSRKLEINLMDDENYSFLTQLVEKKQFNLISLVLKKLELKKEVKMKIVLHKNTSNSNAVHVATAVMDSWKFLWNCIESFTLESDRKDILLTRGGVNNLSVLVMSQRLGPVFYDVVLEVFTNLWGHDEEVLVSMFDSLEETSTEENILPLEHLWNSIEEQFKLEHLKQLLFEPFKLFNDLIVDPSGTKIALKAVKKIFNPEELETFVETGWFFNGDVFQALNLENSGTLWDFFRKLGYEKKQLEEVFKAKEIKKDCIRNESPTISQIFDALINFINSNEFEVENHLQLLHWAAKNLVEIGANHSIEYFSHFLEFVQQTFNEIDQKKVFLIKSNSMNTFMAVTSNENKTILNHLNEILKSLFDKSDIQKALENIDDPWLFETFYYYVENAKGEALEKFWAFMSEKLPEKEDQKTLLLRKDENGFDALMVAARNKYAIDYVIELAKGILNGNDFINALESGDQNWLVDVIGVYAVCLAFDPFKKFWSILDQVLNKDQQKLALLQLRKIGFNAISICPANKDQKTVKFIIEIAKKLFFPDDFTTALKSGDGNWLAETLCRFARVAKSEAFRMFWSMIENNLTSTEDQKTLFLQKDRREFMGAFLNAFMASAHNPDKYTIGLVVDIANKLFEPDDFAKALTSEDQNWLVYILCQHANFSDFNVFDMFWSLLDRKLNKEDQKFALLQKDENEQNALSVSAYNEDTSTIKCVINAAKSLFDAKDFEEVLLSDGPNWIADCLCEYVATADPEIFDMLWSLLQEHLDPVDLREVLLTKKLNGINAFVGAAHCRSKSTTERLLNKARDLFSRDDFTEALESEENNWVLDSLCECAFKAKPEGFKMLWSYLKDNLENDQQKLIFVQKNLNGVNALMASAGNVSEFAVQCVLDSAKFLLIADDFSAALTTGDNNWVVDTLSRFALVADSGKFEMFWSLLQENLDSNQLKLVLMQKDRNGLNALMSSGLNEKELTLSLVLMLYKERFDEIELRQSLFFVYWFNHPNEKFNQFGIHFEPEEYSKYLVKKFHDLPLIYFMNFINNHVVLNVIWKTSLKNFEETENLSEMKTQLLVKDKVGHNSFAIAAFKNRVILITFLKWFKTNFENELEQVFEEKNESLDPLMHVVASKCNQSLCSKFLDFVSSSFDDNKIRQLLSEKNGKYENPLTTSKRNNSGVVFKVFKKFHEKYFPRT